MPASFEATTESPVSENLSTVTAKVRAKADTKGKKDFTYNCQDMTQSSSTKTTCTKGDDVEVIYGEYNVISIADSSNTLTLTDAKGNTFTLEQPFIVAAKESQTTTQTIEGNTTSFTIKMESGDIAPKFYPGNQESTSAFSSCPYDVKTKTVTCTPTSTELKKDTDYKIYYKKPCENAFTDTGITVTVKETPAPSPTSAGFSSLSKFALFLGGLLLF